jgi:VWFA-related protein
VSRFDQSIRRINWRLSIAIALILACCLLSGALIATSVSAQSSNVQITATSTDAWPTVVTTITVVDGSGQPITGLPPEAFSATLAGAEMELTGLQTTSDPGIGVAVVLTFDVSGSMAGPPLESARAAGQALIAQLGPSDQAAVVAFSDQPAVIQAFTADKDALSAAVDSLAIGGNTGLYAAVQESVRLAETAPLPRRAIVLLSDGVDFGGAATDPAQSLAAVSESSVLVMSIGLGDQIDESYLSQLAAVGRGQFSVAPAPADLTALYQTAAAVLRQQYVLTLDAGSLDPNVANGGTLRIQTTVGAEVLAGETTIALPAAVLAVVPVTTPVPATVAPAPDSVTAPESQGGNSLLLYALIAIAGGVVVTGALVWRRRRRLVPVAQAPDTEAEVLERFDRESGPLSYPTIQRAVAHSAPGAWLEVSPGNRVALGDSPITVGFSSDCVVVLSNGSSGRTERARIWRRDGNYMLHNLSRVGGISIKGRAVTWAILEDGDEIDIGGCKLLFRDESTGDISSS